MITESTVWIFNGNRRKLANLPSAIFSRLELAEEWIQKTGVTGMLTRYPVDISVYDWAISKSYFEPKKEKDHLPAFIETFTSPVQEHYHYEDGQRRS